ncbi:MAG: ATP-binding protein [Erysipelotrichaceae bacterium]|nr:ATP-binding protein [Erysipelotrichaceae bacterium]
MKENRHLEFKEDISRKFLKTVSAFSYFEGGKIIFGINDKGEICGLHDIDKSQLAIENMINDSISPKPDFSFSQENGTIVLTVKEGRFKPYFYNGKAYRRSDTASIEVDHIELTRLILEGSNLNFEELPYSNQNLTFKYMEDTFRKHLFVSSINNDILKTLGFFDDNLSYNNAAALFADNNSFYGIDMARFGESINIILDRETVSGVSILEQYDRSVSLFEKYYCYEKIEGFTRNTVELIPLEAYREALANALVHRTWDLNTHIRIAMYEDRIEITSPGSLPNGVKTEDYLNGNVSVLRNPIIGNIFFRLKYIEQFGTGVQRIRNAYSSSTKKPEFYVSENLIKVVLPVLSDNYLSTDDEQKIIDLLKSGRPFSSREIAESLSFSKDKAIRLLNSLIDKKYIKTSGNNRSTRYYLL